MPPQVAMAITVVADRNATMRDDLEGCCLRLEKLGRRLRSDDANIWFLPSVAPLPPEIRGPVALRPGVAAGLPLSGMFHAPFRGDIALGKTR